LQLPKGKQLLPIISLSRCLPGLLGPVLDQQPVGLLLLGDLAVPQPVTLVGQKQVELPGVGLEQTWFGQKIPA
jgi:hypothetical protein